MTITTGILPTRMELPAHAVVGACYGCTAPVRLVETPAAAACSRCGKRYVVQIVAVLTEAVGA